MMVFIPNSLSRHVGAVLLDGGLHGFTALTGALLNAPQKFVLLALYVHQVVVGELSPLLLEIALEDVPVAFDFQCCHRPEAILHCGGGLWGEIPMRGARERVCWGSKTAWHMPGRDEGCHHWQRWQVQ